VPPLLVPASPASAYSSARHVAAAESVDTLREEARTLDGARNRLTNGDPAASLQRLADYDRRFANGSLHEEASLLRIEALVRLGNRSDARALATRFLKAYPTSVHAERVKSLSRELPEEKAQ
jgi:outer membrane protein assembly factor BamD (BamD/ComL family)